MAGCGESGWTYQSDPKWSKMWQNGPKVLVSPDGRWTSGLQLSPSGSNLFSSSLLASWEKRLIEFVWNVVPKSPASQNTQLLLGSILTLMRRGRVGSLAPRLKSFISGYLSEIATKCANLLGWSYLHIQCRARSISPRPFLHFFTCQSRLTPMTIKKSEMLCLQQDESPGRDSQWGASSQDDPPCFCSGELKMISSRAIFSSPSVKLYP